MQIDSLVQAILKNGSISIDENIYREPVRKSKQIIMDHDGYDQAITYCSIRPYLLAGVEMDEYDAKDYLIHYRGLSLSETLLYLKDLTSQVVQ